MKFGWFGTVKVNLKRSAETIKIELWSNFDYWLTQIR